MAGENTSCTEGHTTEVSCQRVQGKDVPPSPYRFACRTQQTSSRKPADVDSNHREIKQEKARPRKKRVNDLCLTRIQKISGDGNKNIANNETHSVDKGV